MPNCFTLTRIGETQPSTLARVDEELCRYFGEPVDDSRYFASWVDCEGFALALGLSWEWMREEWPARIQIIDYLCSNYEADAFAYR